MTELKLKLKLVLELISVLVVELPNRKSDQKYYRSET
jgi:hypothetical protein